MKWLKKLFKRRETKEISVNEIKAELEQKLTNTKKQIEFLLYELKQAKKAIAETASELKTAQLEEKNQQIKNRVISNRDSYIYHIEIMLKNIEIPSDISLIEDFLRNATKAIQEFAQRSAKSYQITQYLIGKELAKVSDKIKELANKLKEIENKKLEMNDIEQTIEKIRQIKQDKEQKTRTKKEIGILEEEIKNLKKELEQKEKNKKELKESKEYKEFLSLNEKLEKNKEELKKIKSKTVNLFSPLQKAMRKYAKITLKPEIIEKYLENPYSALLEDDEIKISKILQKIDIKALDIKEKEKKIKKAIIEVSEEHLKNIKQEDEKIKEKLKAIEENLSKINISEKIEADEKEIQEISRKRKEKEKEFAKKKEHLEKENEEELKKQLQEKYQELINEEIKIIS